MHLHLIPKLPINITYSSDFGLNGVTVNFDLLKWAFLIWKQLDAIRIKVFSIYCKIQPLTCNRWIDTWKHLLLWRVAKWHLHQTDSISQKFLQIFLLVFSRNILFPAVVHNKLTNINDGFVTFNYIMSVWLYTFVQVKFNAFTVFLVESEFMNTSTTATRSMCLNIPYIKYTSNTDYKKWEEFT